MARCEDVLGAIALIAIASGVHAQTAAETRENEAVGQAINYVFATELGSGVYDLDGRTLQIYRFTYEKELREVNADTMGVRFVVPFTFGFFDFKPLDVLSEGIPTRVDSVSVVPGIELDYLLDNGWHVIPYLRAGASIASSSIDGWLYGIGVGLERRTRWANLDSYLRSEISLAGVGYRQEVPADKFARLRQGVDLTRGIGWKIRGREIELGLYAVFDFILDPPTAPVANARSGQSLQADFGFTLGTRPSFKIWRWDAPRLGVGYRLAGELTSWHFLIGVPF
ncbi:MAG TPA: hypothetical protein VFS58_11750 [Steroidobacteraceae bacterium]|nr:hypothetical protein [Steroidobacteraceae bacterium]